ncbi:FeoB-associated Cys-rich membrane protein [Fimbriiglobus ruber]|uniref:FeoB-associated Cys-rich membrane protein n=1 Tax=Fimbriiglobus ruber TaxID=1908690 RepID=A0A225DDS9_9BACT|nr:FeoB-associated Cys-rich membrane protein [Fimbriiglobus ruber]OWK39143.1 hypothetical protein FRUB_06225 [Fimbriiglobus ruber]
MDTQLIIVAAVVVLALAYVTRATWRTWFGPSEKTGCASGCGACKTTPVAASPEDRKRIALPQV